MEFVAGALPKTPAREVESHMARCSECRRLIVEIAKANDAPDTDVDPPAAPVNVAAAAFQSTAPGTRRALEGQIDSAATTLELKRGSRVQRYTLLYQLGEGGMGSVHAAFDPKLDRRVALKFLRTDLIGSAKQGHRERLVREARALARLSHANVVSIFDVAETDGSVFLAMELIDGSNARIWRELGARSIGEIVKVYRESLSALIAAHEQGIIHRDFKPDNVMVGADGIARVTDFGLARSAMVDVDELLADAESQGVDWETLTQTGLVLGTPRYMAPEQFSGIANEFTDQFSFCLSLYEALYGHYPLGTKTPRSLLPNREISEQILSPLNKKVPDNLRRILLRGMAVDPRDRWPSLTELQYELSQVLVPNNSTMRWAALAGITALVAGAAFFFAPEPPPAAITDNSAVLEEFRAMKDEMSWRLPTSPNRRQSRLRATNPGARPGPCPSAR
jgi:serine/threonine protein kinase